MYGYAFSYVYMRIHDIQDHCYYGARALAWPTPAQKKEWGASIIFPRVDLNFNAGLAHSPRPPPWPRNIAYLHPICVYIYAAQKNASLNDGGASSKSAWSDGPVD